MPKRIPYVMNMLMNIYWDWDDDDEEDQVKGEDKDRDKENNTLQTNPRFFVVMTLTLQLPKPSITEYFGKMSRVISVIDAPEE